MRKDKIQELLAEWERKQERNVTDEQKELSAARKRVAELDTLIQNLYEAQIKGTLPERQVQRLSAQYDEEQLKLENRILEIEAAQQKKTLSKADINRFVSLVKKYKDFTELTDLMLNDLIEKVEVHKATGEGIYRRQKIDVYFSFIGHYDPLPELTDEEYAAQADAQYEEKKAAKRERANRKRRDKLAALKKAAETDPEAAAELEARKEKARKQASRNREKKKALKEADPEYAAAERALVREKARNAYYRRRSNSKATELAKKETQKVCV